jgi:hypothetical protein
MNTRQLIPLPSHWNAFRRSKERFVPETSGCYVLSTFSGVVLYIGQATNLRRRMINHLDSPTKTASTEFGRATLFHWFECSDIATVERTWMNIHIQHEGALPLLNRAYAPVST